MNLLSPDEPRENQENLAYQACIRNKKVIPECRRIINHNHLSSVPNTRNEEFERDHTSSNNNEENIINRNREFLQDSSSLPHNEATNSDANNDNNTPSKIS